MAFGLPCVATDVGTTPLLITHHKNGMLVKSDDEWVDALELLVKKPDLRRKLGQAARESVVANYSLTAIGTQYCEVLEKVMAKSI